MVRPKLRSLRLRPGATPTKPSPRLPQREARVGEGQGPEPAARDGGQSQQRWTSPESTLQQSESMGEPRKTSAKRPGHRGGQPNKNSSWHWQSGDFREEETRRETLGTFLARAKHLSCASPLTCDCGASLAPDKREAFASSREDFENHRRRTIETPPASPAPTSPPKHRRKVSFTPDLEDKLSEIHGQEHVLATEGDASLTDGSLQDSISSPYQDCRPPRMILLKHDEAKATAPTQRRKRADTDFSTINTDQYRGNVEGDDDEDDDDDDESTVTPHIIGADVDSDGESENEDDDDEELLQIWNGPSMSFQSCETLVCSNAMEYRI